MRKFLLVLLVVMLAIGILAACAPIQHSVEEYTSGVEEYTSGLPEWAIVAGAIILFLIGLSIIWKLIPGFIKFIALIVLAAIIAGVAYGLWPMPLKDQIIDKGKDLVNTVDEFLDEQQETETP